jgi:signal transduction histidine kinase
VFCSAVLLRFFLVTIWNSAHASLEVLPVATAMGFSIYVLSFAREGSPRLLLASVSIDAVTCFLALLPNIVYPTSFSSILMMPDTATIILITVAAGFRHSVSAALLSGALNGASFIALVVVDRAIKGAMYANGLAVFTVYGIVLLGAAAMAVVVARRTQRLTELGATHAIAAQQAQQGVATLLSEHHDVRSLVSSATINMAMLEQALGASRTDAGEAMQQLHGDLGEIHAQISRLLDRACLALDEPVATADVAAAVDGAAQRARALFKNVHFDVEQRSDAARARVAGGVRSLEVCLRNILINACEGDGRSAATTVQVRYFEDDTAIGLEVSDDGPGFSASQLEAEAGSVPSKKTAGTGHGLAIAARTAERSSGRLQIANGDGGGARVTISFPKAP